jgi:hypothetical protein
MELRNMTPEENPELVSDENEEILEDIDEAAEDVDELVVRLTELATATETRDTQILSEVQRCQTELMKLSTATLTAENPLLTQILTQLVEMRVELSSLKSSADTRQRNRELSDSETPEQVPADESHDETPGNPVENGDPTSGRQARKNRFV